MPPKKKSKTDSCDKYKYLNGWGGYNNTEALEGAIPELGNTPQKCPYGLYAEQINGTSFTKAKHANLRTWYYRIRPSIANHSKYSPCTEKFVACETPSVLTPDQIRWKPLPMPPKDTKVNFIQGMHCYAGAGAPEAKGGLRIYVYACNTDMENCAYQSSDGDMLIIPQVGTLDIKTECGRIEVPSGFICVIPRGIRMQVAVPKDGARGYVCEVFDNHFETPPLGVIGANGLSNLKDFQVPTAWYEDKEVKFTNYHKFGEKMFKFEQTHSPFDVVAWSGNYAPFRYDLAKFCVINTVSYDHLDPSIFCVITCQTAEFGVASCDFVIFPPRWMVATDTFRPPYYHKNIMSEFMGNIRGTYEAKPDGGFNPGGCTLHSCMVAHGPATEVFETCSNVDLKPTPPNQDHLAFMFESTYMLKLTPWADKHLRDDKYMECWDGFKKYFTPNSQ